MKSSALFCLAALSCLPSLDLGADESVETIVTAEKKDAPAEREKTLLTAAQIDELLAPIALYPDPLVALILPASTFPTDVVLAARYLKDGKDPEAIENQTWDDSVKALARYPEVLKWMDENLAWTQQLGAAFLVQPAAVMNGTQRLRAAAVAAGNLKDTPEQKVVVEREVIRIVPAEREVIYVPVYDPIYVYRPRVVEVCGPGPLVTFSIGYRTGFWLSYYCNWGYNSVVYINRPHRTVYWYSHPAWSCPSPAVVVHHHVWRPAPVRVQAVCRDFERRPVHRVVQPTANTYVQNRPGHEAPPPHGFARSDDADSRRSRPETGRPERREVAATAPAVTNRRDRENLNPRPSRSAESTRVESAPAPAPAISDAGDQVQTGRQMADRRNRRDSIPARVEAGGAVSSIPAAPATERPRPSRAPTVTVNTDTSAPSPAPRVDRRDRSGSTAATGATTHGSSVSSSGFGRNPGENQGSRRSSGSSLSSGAATSSGEVPVTRPAPAASSLPRRSDSRRESSAGNTVIASTSTASSGMGQRRSAAMEQSRGSAVRAEVQSSGRAPRQGRSGEGTTSSSAIESDSEHSGGRTRR